MGLYFVGEEDAGEDKKEPLDERVWILMVDEDFRRDFTKDQNLEGEERDKEREKKALDRLTEADIELRRERYEDIREGD